MSVEPFYCTSCRGRAGQPGVCPRCPGEPLLDLRDAEVRHTLDDLDARARHTRQARTILGAVALVGVPCWFIIVPYVGDVFIAVILAAVAASLAAALMLRFFPARRQLPDLDDAEWAALKPSHVLGRSPDEVGAPF